MAETSETIYFLASVNLLKILFTKIFNMPGYTPNIFKLYLSQILSIFRREWYFKGLKYKKYRKYVASLSPSHFSTNEKFTFVESFGIICNQNVTLRKRKKIRLRLFNHIMGFHKRMNQLCCHAIFQQKDEFKNINNNTNNKL